MSPIDTTGVTVNLPIAALHRSRDGLVRPDGVIVTNMVELPRSEWAVVIHDHHEGYISWEEYLANQERLAHNHTRKGARPPR